MYPLLGEGYINLLTKGKHMNSKKPAFVNQVRTCQNALHELQERARADGSQFTWRIEDAFRHIDCVLKTYTEVLERDAVEDYDYRPSMKVLKGEHNAKD
tara:strand:- start:66 stop:362 length:297 start_codon:yes stop_codon:yes gene_type:complete